MLRNSVSLIIFILFSAHSTAAAVSLTDSMLHDRASLVVSGEVKRIYSTTEIEGDSLEMYEHTHYIAEVLPTSIEKGEDMVAHRPVYVRFLKIKWMGEGAAPPGHDGNKTIPAKGDHVTVFLQEADDGGFYAIVPNGCKVHSN